MFSSANVFTSPALLDTTLAFIGGGASLRSESAEPTCAPLAPRCGWPAVTPGSCSWSARCWGRGAAACGKAAAACGRPWQSATWGSAPSGGSQARRPTRPSKAPLRWRWSGHGPRPVGVGCRSWGRRHWGRRRRSPVGSQAGGLSLLLQD